MLRGIACPIRDRDWRTLAVAETGGETSSAADRLRHVRHFVTADGTLAGLLSVDAVVDAARADLTAQVEIAVQQSIEVNRAGFVLLHPAGLSGAPLEVRHSDGGAETSRFPDRISPSQPAFDIVGLRYANAGVEVDIVMEGEVFEMEDQRNWTDASFKTYCRPLALPIPYRLEPSTPVRQTIRLSLRRTSTPVSAVASSGAVEATMPRIVLAHEPAQPKDASPVALSTLAIDGLLVRVDAAGPVLARLPVAAPVTLEIVTDADAAAGIAAAAAACRSAGLSPRRVVAIPRAYLSSHQPQGPWPDGPAPRDLVPLLRSAFPAAEIGGGVLTNFTEFNRCPPDPAAIDFATFGTTAIVHTADDRSVVETLEALPAVFQSARALVPGCALHLGLISIGMRSNPYGAAVAPNPDRRRIAMAMADPRQATDFAAAWAVGAAAAAARGGVASFAPAMTAGPLGLGRDGALWPLFEVVAALAALGGETVEVSGGPGGPVVIRGAAHGVAANLGPAPDRIAGREIAPMGFAILAAAE